ncbi:efflux RND transporter periplasmic adaptor subunit [Thiomicrorhabdus sp. 6S2-11]|uniref:Efflux RND transporter periplasmic adaptor subunit n=1 Tax=Thiomicrorhabdus marina TaxID=2818442 RepID=A0ABS3Q4X4_9GAMM|nr:efflux RND transporter periplasmic adaptor subunit [Thiomicrorhabdus marina]MBO1927336.1 efflux RND transporter periplasmic adaptor subunit [Thiomicrorhabdus marina]
MWNYFRENQYMQTTKAKEKNNRLSIALALAGVLVFVSGCQQDQQVAEVPLLKVKTVLINDSPSSYNWHLNGVLQARIETPLALQVGGKIKNLQVDLGDSVLVDQALLSVDDSDFVLAVKSAQAAIKATAAEIAQTKADLKRIEALQQRKLASEQAKQQLENQLKALQAQQNANQQQLKQAENQLDYTTLKAPNSGVISQKMVQDGQVVGAGQALLQLIVDGQREIRVAVPENRIGQLPKQAQAIVQQQSYSVTLRTTEPQSDAVSRTWNAYYQLADADILNQISLGQTATLQFSAPNQGVEVPLSALYEQGDYPSVWLLVDGKAKRQAVQIIRLGDESAWVKGDFPAHAKVIALGVHLLNEGQSLEEMP